MRFHRHLGAEPSYVAPDEAAYLLKGDESSVVDFKEVGNYRAVCVRDGMGAL